MHNYFFLLDFSMRKFIKIQFDLGVPAIAVGLSAISFSAALQKDAASIPNAESLPRKQIRLNPWEIIVFFKSPSL